MPNIAASRPTAASTSVHDATETRMLGLTTLGTIHTLIGLVAVLAGAYALIRDREITLGSDIGRFFVLTVDFGSLDGRMLW